MKLKSGKFLGLVAVALAAAAAGGWWWWQSRQSQKPQYQTTEVSRGPLVQVVTATGQLNPVVNVQVGSQISGTIAKLFADFNSPVQAGQVIAEIDPATYRAAALQAEGELAHAQASLELAAINARRAADLFANQLIPQADYDQAQASLRQAEAVVKIRQAAVERARVELARCTIYSPVDGVVISRNVDVGQTVAASLSAPTLFVIANDLTQMQINANVAEADIGGVTEGQAVEFTVDAFPYRTFHGHVIQVRNAPTTVQNVVTYDTVVAVNNPDLKLRPGMTANVAIIIAQRDQALKVANAALRFQPPELSAPAAARPAVLTRPTTRGQIERSPRQTVYRVGRNGELEPLTITVGISDGWATEVLDGLAEGDRLATGTVAPATTSTRVPTNPFGGSFRRR